MSRNIRTLRDFNNDDAGRDSGGESDGEGPRPENFFVGGSEHSGQQVQGPDGPRRGDEFIQRIFESARRNGAEAISQEQLAAEQRQRHPASGGRGVRLGGFGQPEPEVAGNVDDSQHSEAARPQSNIQRVLMHTWTNGFSIDDGPLRSFDDPESRAFLQEVMQGNVPRELETKYRGKIIDVQLAHKGTPYEPPKLKPFEGVGTRLGNVVPEVAGAGSSAAPAIPVPVKSDLDKALEAAKAEAKVDSSLPTTNIQIRLPDGQRLVGSFNHTHTISAIRNFICTARPDVAFQPFQLMTTFPNKVLEDETLGLSDAGLLNAVVLVKPQA